MPVIHVVTDSACDLPPDVLAEHQVSVVPLDVRLGGRPGDAVTAGITTAVVMVVAAVSPQHAWQQPILRFADTVIGVAVGVAAAWLGLSVLRPWLRKVRYPRG
jgi:multisubunit Na+/H+ antiporter MnhB subunit